MHSISGRSLANFFFTDRIDIYNKGAMLHTFPHHRRGRVQDAFFYCGLPSRPNPQ
jgi:hypothetical protein